VRSLRRWASALLFCLVSVPAIDSAGGLPQSGSSLTEAARLARIYDAILGAKFDDALQQLKNACPPAPREACRALAPAVLWWQILMDQDNRSLDARLRQEAREAIEAADAWTRREPKRAEAWFYLAGAYAPLVQLKVLRGERISAARDGNRIRAALEKAVALDSRLHDAYFGIGLYHYYADVAPAAARILRVLMLMPGGDKEKGMREMLRAREQGVLLAGEADFQLHWLYLWYEDQPRRAIELVQDLDRRFPSNPVFLQRAAEIQSDELKDHRTAAATWETLLARARDGQVQEPRSVEMRARIGLAQELIALSDPQSAIDHLKAALALKSAAPYSAQALAQLHLGIAYDRIGRRDLANASYDAAISLAPSDDPLKVRASARTRRRANANMRE
jgi:tetratricopeptide (TPR) repeat protein